MAFVTLFYALGFATNFYPLYLHTDPISDFIYVSGSEIFFDIQPFNKALFNFTLYYFLLTMVLFLSLSHKRRLYYTFNYIVNTVFAMATAGMGAYILTNVIKFKTQYTTTVDFERYYDIASRFTRLVEYHESTFFLDVGYALSFAIFTVAALVILNLTLKISWMRNERWAED
jgi:ABC-type multidrug transport system fused ATPase/permease subunit